MATSSRWRATRLVYLISAMLAVLQGQALTQPAFNVLVNFDSTNGANPAYMSLVQGEDGNFYGTTGSGGTADVGTVFRVVPGGTLTTLHSFSGTDGSSPISGLVLATDGFFYGTTQGGSGSAYAGTVFKIDPADGTLTTLHEFNNSDGEEPGAPLMQATDGNLYGTTAWGGAKNYGTVFKISPDGAFTTVHSFDLTDGALPYGALIQASDGNLYGTTYNGGSGDCAGSTTGGCGTIYMITRRGVLTTLYNFGPVNGNFPFSGLVQAMDGNFYGTTAYGGPSSSKCPSGTCGTVYRFERNGVVTVLHDFDETDGDAPTAGLIQGANGILYGTTSYGGAYNGGTIFAIRRSGTTTVLHMFDDADGVALFGGLCEGTNAIFYGAAYEGGSTKLLGTLYSLSTGLTPFVTFIRAAGRIGQTGGILGQGFTGTTSVSLNGIPTSFTVISDTFLKATVPAGATTGFVTVTTPNGRLTSNVPFHVIP